jgi:hypothetical protein
MKIVSVKVVELNLERCWLFQALILSSQDVENLLQNINKTSKFLMSKIKKAFPTKMLS